MELVSSGSTKKKKNFRKIVTKTLHLSRRYILNGVGDTCSEIVPKKLSVKLSVIQLPESSMLQVGHINDTDVLVTQGISWWQIF